MKNFAHLIKTSPFYPIFERGMAPIKNILVPCQGIMEEPKGDQVRKFYWLDVGKLTTLQIQKVADLVAAQCDGNRDEIEAYMRKEGQIPLRDIHVASVSTDRVAAFL